MRVPFRQGLLRWQSDISGSQAFLQKSTLAGDYVSLIVSPDPTIFTAAHGRTDYLIEETKSIGNAWGPFQPIGQTQYLYWDVNLLDGSVSRGFTLLAPAVSKVAPPHPVNDQHWFDTDAMLMKVWTEHAQGQGGKWVVKVRVFAAIYDQSATIIPIQTSPGSQVAINTPCNAGHILLNDIGNPLRDRDGSLLTTESSLLVSRSATTPIKLESAIIDVQATEHIPAFYLVSIIGRQRVALASSHRVDRQVGGIMLEDMYPGEVRRVVLNGNVSYDQWTWPDSAIGRPLFCGPTGEVTLDAPQTGIVQQIGIVFDSRTITVNLMTPIKR